MTDAAVEITRQPARARLSRLRPRRLRLQLRARITMAFALGALALSLTVATITFLSARSNIVGQAVQADEATALTNARSLQGIAPGDASQTQALLTQLTEFDKSSNSLSFFTFTGAWIEAAPYFVPYPAITHEDLPTSLVTTVQDGSPAEQTFAFDGVAYVGVGYPIGVTGFFQVFPTTSVSGTLRALVLALLFAALLTTVLGAGLGRWAAKRVLRPLRDATKAASAIASGALHTRLDTDPSSDLAELAAAFNQMVDGVQERIEREARFASDVAHELRSPLQTLAGSLEVLESRKAELPERSRQALELLSDEVHRFQRMVFDLLEMSRLDAGAANLVLSVVTVGELVRNALASAGAGDLPVEMDERTAGRYLNIDKRRFERVITNLVVNAERYAGGATRVDVHSEDGVVRIAVEDAGPGVDKEDRERIFGRFARGAAAAGSRGSGRGTGLGLALVAEHARLHGGRVWVEDAAPRGARFVVELPVAPDELVGEEDGEGAA